MHPLSRVLGLVAADAAPAETRRGVTVAPEHSGGARNTMPGPAAVSQDGGGDLTGSPTTRLLSFRAAWIVRIEGGLRVIRGFPLIKGTTETRPDPTWRHFRTEPPTPMDAENTKADAGGSPVIPLMSGNQSSSPCRWTQGLVARHSPKAMHPKAPGSSFHSSRERRHSSNCAWVARPYLVAAPTTSGEKNQPMAKLCRNAMS